MIDRRIIEWYVLNLTSSDFVYIVIYIKFEDIIQII